MTVEFMLFHLRTLSRIQLSRFYSSNRPPESPILAESWDSLRKTLVSGETDSLHLKRLELLETPFDVCAENQCFLICIAHDLLGYSEPTPVPVASKAAAAKPGADATVRASSQQPSAAASKELSGAGVAAIAQKRDEPPPRHEFLNSLLTGTCDTYINGLVLLVEVVETWLTSADVQLHFVGALKEARSALMNASLLAEYFRSSSLCDPFIDNSCYV